MSTPSDNSAANLSGNSGEDFNPPAESPVTTTEPSTTEPSPLLLPEPAAKPTMPTEAQVQAAKFVLDSLNKVFSPAGSEPTPVEDDADAEPKRKRAKRSRPPTLPPAPWVDLTGPTIEERLEVLEAKSIVAEAERKEIKRDLSEIRTAQVTAMRMTSKLTEHFDKLEQLVAANQSFCAETFAEHSNFISRINQKIKVELARIDEGCDELAVRIEALEG